MDFVITFSLGLAVDAKVGEVGVLRHEAKRRVAKTDAENEAVASIANTALERAGAMALKPSLAVRQVVGVNLLVTQNAGRESHAVQSVTSQLML